MTDVPATFPRLWRLCGRISTSFLTFNFFSPNHLFFVLDSKNQVLAIHVLRFPPLGKKVISPMLSCMRTFIHFKIVYCISLCAPETKCYKSRGIDDMSVKKTQKTASDV
jgi:hypothetical protein